MNSQVRSSIESLGICLNSTIVKAIESHPEQIVLDAIAALSEAIAKGTVANPNGFLVSAIKNQWKPNPAASSESILLLFSDWFSLARKQGIALASQKTDDGIFIYTALGEWVSFEEIEKQYPIESLQKAESEAA